MGTTMRFREPLLAGMEHYDTVDDFDSSKGLSDYTSLFIYPALVKPGKLYYLV